MRGNASTAEGVATALGKLTDPKGVPTLLGRFRFESRFSTWVYRVVMNVCLDHLRRAGTRREVQAPEPEPGQAEFFQDVDACAGHAGIADEKGGGRHGGDATAHEPNVGVSGVEHGARWRAPPEYCDAFTLGSRAGDMP